MPVFCYFTTCNILGLTDRISSPAASSAAPVSEVTMTSIEPTTNTITGKMHNILRKCKEKQYFCCIYSNYINMFADNNITKIIKMTTRQEHFGSIYEIKKAGSVIKILV